MQRTVTDAEHPPKKLHGKAEQTKVNDAKGPGRFQIGPFGNVVGVFHVNDSQHAKQIRMFGNRGCSNM